MASETDREGRIPFTPGERLVFQVRWGFIRAGEAVLEVMPWQSFEGKKVFHFVMTARTTEFIDLFYKVRDRIESYTDWGMNRALLYKKQCQGKSKHDVLVTFDWAKNKAQYSDFGEKRDPISLFPGSFDPLSVFYAFRMVDLTEQKEIRTPVTDGKKCVMGRARIIRRERIRVPYGDMDTFLVEPDLEHIGGVFRKSKDAKLRIWVTEQKEHIPVRIESKVLVGSFVAELVSLH